jgi:hypothetical protein
MAKKKRATVRKSTSRKLSVRKKAAPKPRGLSITSLKVGDKILKAGRGHYFKRTGTGIALMRGNSAQANFTCECSGAGGCRVEIDGQSATCLESGCSGSCGWVVNVPGIAGFPNLAVLRG